MIKKQVTPSILNVPKDQRVEVINNLIDMGIQWFHYDVMDNKFVPNEAISIDEIKSFKSTCKKHLSDAHLMVNDPFKYAHELKDYVTCLTIHYESFEKEEDIVKFVNEFSHTNWVGIAPPPSTDFNKIQPILYLFDLVLIMSVEPGFGGQQFIEKTYNKLKEIKIPFILSTIAMSDNVDKNLYSSVCVDDRKESEKVVNFLCDKGHKKIAILAAGKSDKSISKLRIEGYENALKNRNIPINKNLIRHTDNNENIQIIGNGYKLMKELLESKEEFTAVYSISDSMAIGASKAILESGKRIPEDYSVVGFDGLDMTYYYNPSITTIRQPVEEMARETTKILFDLINKKAKNQHKVFEAELISRESTSELSR